MRIEPSVVWINEVHYDNLEGDAVEFIEIACNADVNMGQTTKSFFMYFDITIDKYKSFRVTGAAA